MLALILAFTLALVVYPILSAIQDSADEHA
ncbi:exported hypothetical protein [Cupriavidus taiwanensis]|uniref:Uncharacterized protein n=1 Tax=Cupriavidus taiwanensis TaxID=164546 RepID=A0A7Z7JHW5_9BURK|nr:exported hypothetical protein [Cupriavidus taiwanensis]SOZ96339.1 exported hypothetical protein [Cupriavidus taiwanensis]SPC25708.1 exported hypothetical protein [Cupriavidus taiwanensis]